MNSSDQLGVQCDLDVEDNLGDQAVLLTVAGECDFVQVPHVGVQHYKKELTKKEPLEAPRGAALLSVVTPAAGAPARRTAGAARRPSKWVGLVEPGAAAGCRLARGTWRRRGGRPALRARSRARARRR